MERDESGLPILPLDILGEIFGRLRVPDMFRVRRVCAQWSKASAQAVTKVSVMPAWTDRVSFKTLKSFSARFLFLISGCCNQVGGTR